MEEEQKNTSIIRRVKALRRDVAKVIREVEGNYNNPEMNQARTKLMEARHWMGEHLKVLGHELPEKYFSE